jgi:hypothetical protein
MKHLDASRDPIDTAVYKQWVVDYLTPRIYADHVAAYRACCCPGTPAPYWAWIGVTTVPPLNCTAVGLSIRAFGSCSNSAGHW